MNVQFSDDFFSRLFQRTMQSLLERTRDDGFCLTSYGELHDVKCYGECHYCRDAAEAACVLADQGYLKQADAILHFTLDHTPQGQYFIVHAFKPDGTPLHNNIQVDTPAHVARALERFLAMGGDQRSGLDLFKKLGKVFADTRRYHLDPRFNLYNSGNYNEQLGGGKDPVFDLFTNGAMYAGLKAMESTAAMLNAETEEYAGQAQQLSRGIEENLYDCERGMYRPALLFDGRVWDRPVNWISLYPQRWYPGKNNAWKKAEDQLWKNGCNDWNGLRIPSGETSFMTCRTLGKVMAHMMGFAAQEEQLERLQLLMEFLRQTIRQPQDLYPECWMHHLPKPGQSPYLDWFFSEFKGVWESFADNPQGDYTIDSGNCEQCSVFLDMMIHHIIGFHGNWKDVVLAPVLPQGMTIKVTGRHLGIRDGKIIRASMTRSDKTLEFKASQPVKRLTLTLGSNMVVYHDVAEARLSLD